MKPLGSLAIYFQDEKTRFKITWEDAFYQSEWVKINSG